MHKVVHSENIKAALVQQGWTQKHLADLLGVSAQAVTLWLKGSGLPRPDKLLKMATALRLRLDQLIVVDDPDRPIVAFRRRAAMAASPQRLEWAVGMGKLLRAIQPYLPERRMLRTELTAPSSGYADVQRAVGQTRTKLGIGPEDVLHYSALIGEFRANDAFLIPVLWGEKQCEETGLHILLPLHRVTFVYLNLDTRVEDFKFWMAHELAHVYTPALAGTEEGEDFAEAFAGALLFPQPLAESAWREAMASGGRKERIRVLMRHARLHKISLFTVYRQVQEYVAAHGVEPLALDVDKDIHAVRNAARGQLVSEIQFRHSPPDPAAYIAAATHAFQSEFFPSLRRMLAAQSTGPGYLQQILDIPLADAIALHAVLTR